MSWKYWSGKKKELPIFTEVASPPNMKMRAVTWSSDLEIFCMVGLENGNSINCAVSSDGISWTTGNIGQNNNWSAVCWSEFLQLFVATSITGTNRVATSTDGINWTLRTASNNLDWRKIISIENLNLLLAVRQAASSSALRFMTSPDGINWTSRNANIGFNSTDVDYNANLGIVVCVGTSNVIYSSDAITWSSTSFAGNNQNVSLFSSKTEDLFLSGKQSGSGVDRAMSSDDGLNWAGMNVSAGSNFFNQHEKSGFYVSLAINGTEIRKSLDAVTWDFHQDLAVNGENSKMNMAYGQLIQKLLLIAVDRLYIG